MASGTCIKLLMKYAIPYINRARFRIIFFEFLVEQHNDNLTTRKSNRTNSYYKHCTITSLVDILVTHIRPGHYLLGQQPMQALLTQGSATDRSLAAESKF